MLCDRYKTIKKPKLWRIEHANMAAIVKVESFEEPKATAVMKGKRKREVERKLRAMAQFRTHRAALRVVEGRRWEDFIEVGCVAGEPLTDSKGKKKNFLRY